MGKIVRARVAAIAGIAVILVSLQTARAKEFVINTAAQAPMVNAEHNGFLDQLTKEIFRRLESDVKIVLMKANARTLINVDKGIDDGNLVRIAGMEKIFKNLRRVPEHMTVFEFSCFTKDPNIKIRNWDDLEPYNVAFIRGWKILERNVTKAQSINLVKDSGQLFDLLKNDRTDIVIFGLVRGKYVLQAKEIEGVRVLSPPLASQKVYMYLNKKHEDVVPQAAEALAKMKADGTYRKIFDSSVGSFVSEAEAQRLLAN